MKKSFITIGALLICTAPVWAQPFSAPMGSDTYGISQGGANNLLIPTPNDDNDNPGPYGGTPYTLGGGPNPADINDAINLLLGTNYVHNSDVDFLRHTGPDNAWQDLSSQNQQGPFVFISLTADFTNSLYTYDVGDPTTLYQVIPGQTGYGFVGDGSAGKPFVGGVNPLSSNNFGWALVSDYNGTEYIWDSNPAFNPDDLDHMLTYHLANLQGRTVYVDVDGNIQQYKFNDPYLLAWEDLPLRNGKLGDEDYDDSIFLVDRVRPIPEPISLVLLASGFMGMIGLKRKIG